MREYRTSLQKRRHRSRKLVERYWSDPEFRLKSINADRARRGSPLISSLDEVALDHPYNRKRDDRGRFA